MTAISALVALVVLVYSLLLVFFARRHLHAELEGSAQAYAELAALRICDAYEKYAESGLSTFEAIVSRTAALNTDLRALAIYTTSGEILFHSDDMDLGSRETRLRFMGDERERPLPYPLGHELSAWHDRIAGKKHYVVLKPHVDEWGTYRYAVAFYFAFDREREVTAAMMVQLAAVASLALALGVGCAWLLSAQSLGPVEKLTAGARLLAEGQLDRRIAVTTGDEFEELGRALDQMAGRLRSTIGDLETSNEQLNRLNEHLQELDRVKGDLLANVSHELRTPLTAISGYVEAMQEGLLGELDETQTASMEVVERNIRRLRGMIDQLLSYTRMESGELKVELRAFELEPILTHAVQAQAAIHGRDLDLRSEIGPNLPEVYGDPGRIAQVVENLLTNAIKFSPAGYPVTLVAREVETGVEVEVQDEGLGIPPDAQQRVFDRFYQVDTGTRRRFGGMGLGLAIVREILELCHSEIRLESREGEGSTFRFVLPYASERSGAVCTRGGPRVVIVDDDAVFVQAVAAHLAAGGFAVDTAATAEQGHAMVERLRPDIIVLDRLLPDSDGFDLLARFVEGPRTREIPVVVVTVRPERALGLRLGAVEYLTKPVAAETLLATLRQHLRKKPPPGPWRRQA